MSGGKYGTNFVESEAILAIVSEDEEEVRRLLATMLPGERDALHQAAMNLAEVINTTFFTGTGL